MSGIKVEIDRAEIGKLVAKLNRIEKSLTTGPRSPLQDLLNITGLDIVRFAKKSSRMPVDTGRLRASVHMKNTVNDANIYVDKHGKVFNGGLDEPIKEGEEIVVGSNVEYAMLQESKHGFLSNALTEAKPAFDRRKKQLLEKAVKK